MFLPLEINQIISRALGPTDTGHKTVMFVMLHEIFLYFSGTCAYLIGAGIRYFSKPIVHGARANEIRTRVRKNIKNFM